MAMTELAECGADLFLAGHLHISHTGHTKRYNIRGHSALVVQAGTATSTRERGEANSFNVLRIAHPSIVVEKFAVSDRADSFCRFDFERFEHTDDGWMRVGNEEFNRT